MTAKPRPGPSRTLTASRAGLLAGESRAPECAEDERRLVSCGRAMEGHTVRIVEPAEGAELAPGLVGEIQVAGPSVTDGYFGQPELTAKTFLPRRRRHRVAAHGRPGLPGRRRARRGGAAQGSADRERPQPPPPTTWRTRSSRRTPGCARGRRRLRAGSRRARTWAWSWRSRAVSPSGRLRDRSRHPRGAGWRTRRRPRRARPGAAGHGAQDVQRQGSAERLPCRRCAQGLLDGRIRWRFGGRSPRPELAGAVRS